MATSKRINVDELPDLTTSNSSSKLLDVDALPEVKKKPSSNGGGIDLSTSSNQISKEQLKNNILNFKYQPQTENSNLGADTGMMPVDQKAMREQEAKTAKQAKINTAQQYFRNNKPLLKELAKNNDKLIAKDAEGKDIEDEYNITQLEKTPIFQKKLAEVDKAFNDGHLALTYFQNGANRGKPVLTKPDGFWSSLGNSIVNSFVSTKDAIVSISKSPHELANYYDEKRRNLPEVPESVPSGVGSWVGNAVGGLIKPAAEVYIGEQIEPIGGGIATLALDVVPTTTSEKTKEIYYDRMNALEQKYGEGNVPEAERMDAINKAKAQAPLQAIPDEAMQLYLFGRGAGAAHEAAIQSFQKTISKAGVDVGKMALLGGGSELATQGIKEAQSGDGKFDDNISKAALNWAMMEAAFKALPVASKAVGAVYSKFISSNAKNVLATADPEVMQKLSEESVQKGWLTQEQADEAVKDVQDFAKTKQTIPESVPENKAALVTGLIQKNKSLEEEKKTTSTIFHDDINAEIKANEEKAKQILNSNSPLKYETDNLTGEKGQDVGGRPQKEEAIQPEIVEQKGVPRSIENNEPKLTEETLPSKESNGEVVQPQQKSKQELEDEAIYGKPEDRVKLDNSKAKPIIEPAKPIQEMNSEEMDNYANDVRDAFKKQDKELKGKSDEEKEAAYDNTLDNYDDLRQTSQRINFIENSENLDDLASSVRSALSNIKDKPTEYDLAILNAAKNKAKELNIEPADLIKDVIKKVGNRYKDKQDAEFMMQTVLNKLLPKNEQPTKENIPNSVVEDESYLKERKRLYDEYEKVKNIPTEISEQGINEKSGRNFAKVEKASPALDVLADYLNLELKKNGYDILSDKRSGGSYYIEANDNKGNQTETYRISDHLGRGGIYKPTASFGNFDSIDTYFNKKSVKSKTIFSEHTFTNTENVFKSRFPDAENVEKTFLRKAKSGSGNDVYEFKFKIPKKEYVYKEGLNHPSEKPKTNSVVEDKTAEKISSPINTEQNAGSGNTQPEITTGTQEKPPISNENKEKVDGGNPPTITVEGKEDYGASPSMTKMANAVNDAYMQGKFGTKVLDDVITQLPDADGKKIYNTVRGKIENGVIKPQAIRERILTTKDGSAADQAVLLYDLVDLKNKEANIRKEIIGATDIKEQEQLQKELVDVQNDMQDNFLANRLIGRDWHNLGQVRKLWAKNDFSIGKMKEEYMAAKGLKNLSDAQEKEIKIAYDRIREAELKRDAARKDYENAVSENEKLKVENEKLKQFGNNAKQQRKSDRGKKTNESIQKSNERIAKARENLKQLGGNLNSGFDPRVAVELSKIAAEKFYQGVVKIDELVKNVLDDVKDILPAWTEKEIRQHLFPDFKNESSLTYTSKDFEVSNKEVRQKLKAYKELEKEYAIKMFEWQKDRRSDIMSKRPFREKAIDGILRWQRFAVLTYPTTMVKLAAVVAHQIALKPLKFAIQKAMATVLPKSITSKMGIWGDPTLRSLSQYYSNLIKNFSVENLKFQFKGIDPQEVMYGKGYNYDEWAAAKGFLELPGRSHGYIKSFIKKPEFAFAHEQLIQQGLNRMDEISNKLKSDKITNKEREELQKEYKQWDVTNIDNLERINSQALEYGKWSILMNDNKFVNKFRLWADNKGIAGALLRSEFPVVKIPVNFVSRAFAYKYGLIKAIVGTDWAGGATPSALKLIFKGTKDLTTEQADLLGKAITLGSMGTAFFALGYFNKDKVEMNDDGSAEIFGTHLSRNLIHSPEFESFFAGATTGHEKDKGHDLIESWVAGDLDIAKKNPFLSMLQYGFLPKVAEAMISKSNEDKVIDKVQDAVSKKIADMVIPGLVKQPAQWLDTNEPGLHPTKNYIYRKPQGDFIEKLYQNIELGIPYMRQDVPVGKTSTPSNKRQQATQKMQKIQQSVY